jgi:hypothetical protein
MPKLHQIFKSKGPSKSCHSFVNREAWWAWWGYLDSEVLPSV